MSDETPSTTRGRVGHEIFEQVERLVSEEGLSRSQAFQRVSEETGRRAGTVSANYYRVAHQRGAALQPRAPRGSKRAGGGGRRARGGDTGAEAALAKAQEALRELSDVVRRQEKELTALRQQSAQLDRLRTLVQKNI